MDEDFASVKSAIESCKQIYMVMITIAMTNSFLVYIERVPASLDGKYWIIYERVISFHTVILILFLIMIFRFGHGDIRVIDDFYLRPVSKKQTRVSGFFLDFGSIFLHGVMLTFMSFYINATDELAFFVLFAGLLLTDVLASGFVALRRGGEHVSLLHPRAIEDPLNQMRLWWTINNLVFLILTLFGILAFDAYPQRQVAFLSALGFLNSVFSLWAGRDFFFPRWPVAAPEPEVVQAADD